MILAETESQKRILIGAGGQMVKSIGIAARRAIERELGTRVHLELSVRVRRHWRADERLLDRLGHPDLPPAATGTTRTNRRMVRLDDQVLRRARPGAVHRPGLADRRGADARVHERRGAAPHARDGRDALLQPLAPGAVAQGRDVGQHAGA